MSTTPFALDEFDHRLLELLQRDADATLTELGEAVGLSASAVQRRIKRYRESGLMRTVAVLNPSQLATVTLATVLVVLATTGLAHTREVAERLFGGDDNLKRYETRMVFEAVKQGLALPTRPPT